jgi:hypothetical protein
VCERVKVRPFLLATYIASLLTTLYVVTNLGWLELVMLWRCGNLKVFEWMLSFLRSLPGLLWRVLVGG